MKPPLDIDTPVCLFSTSKAVTAILVHKLAEQGGVDLNAPVAHYLPRFAQCDKGQMTISEVLSHRGGFASLDLPKRDRNVSCSLIRRRSSIASAPVHSGGMATSPITP